jgi:MYXO-CTERM domain-containing protein
MTRHLIACAALSCCAAAANAGIINGTFEAGDTGFISSYANNDIWAEGQYAVVQTDTLHPFWVDFPDHTFGNGEGHYMVVNGTTADTGPAWSQTVEVSPFTEYSLSAFFASVFPEAPAAVEFRIDGQLISAFSAPAQVAQWEERTATFTTGESTTIEIAIWDTNQIHTGNDYAIDDITLTSVPTPGAATLIALSGLVSLRRRR